MLKIKCGNIRQFSGRDFNSMLQALPVQLASEVKAYRFDTDRKLSLLAKTMLCHSLHEKDKIGLIRNYCRDASEKPFIPGWLNFSISHSGDVVLLAESKEAIGVDVERIAELDFKELSTFFHQDEFTYILQQNVQDRFYEIWTKKEAVLKAIGVGIVHGLNTFSCVGDSVVVNETEWFFYQLNIGTAYKAYVCTNVFHDAIQLENITNTDFKLSL